MKEAEKYPARESSVIEAPAVKLSLNAAIPPAVAKRFGESMGLYDHPEHSFRMYATIALG